ncbi:D-lactaldehyde dehydrogenase [Pholiota conissans]|uniref:D-lactaldehyde dehydrogenase n=1 Tax=Pholiota conissans TaxID=109636 RepID=A0A9P5Z7D2_9AGAR|nr:D-lactaldehyde dehydrogenase [Pholiota conissans]
MPIVPEGSKVLVTGANGFISMWVIKTLLEQGYLVRGAVRSAEKGKRLREYFAPYVDKVEWVIVEDITKNGAFDEAVKGVSAIEHLASPLTSTSDDPDEFIQPAVLGTVGILKSALKEGPQIKRIVITSSILSVLSTVKSGRRVFNEEDWADEFVNLVKELGSKASGDAKYRASKMLAEKAAWEFVKEHKSEISWDLVTLCPPLVLGPPLQDVPTPNDLNISLKIWFNLISTEKDDQVLGSTHGFIHPKDIAGAHVLALKKEAAGGHRIIVAGGTTTWQDLRNLIYSLKPQLYEKGILPRGNPELQTIVTNIYDTTKSKNILGLEYKTYAEVIHDTLADFEARGWLKEPASLS